MDAEPIKASRASRSELLRETLRLQADNVELERLVVLLQGALAGRDLDPTDARAPRLGLLAKLCPQEVALVGVLVGAYPKLVNHHALDRLIPQRDIIAERDSDIVRVLVSRIRTKLGRETEMIRNVPHIGYAATEALMQLAKPCAGC